MKFNLISLCSVSMLSVLAACGGGGDPGAMVPVAPPPLPTTDPDEAPWELKSTSQSDMLAFLSGSDSYLVKADVVRVSRQTGSGKVYHDSIPGSSDGVVGYLQDDGDAVFRVMGKANPDIVIGTGGYNGPMAMRYRLSPTADWQTASGEFNASVNFEDQTVATGGIVANANNNIEIFGDADIRGGGFDDGATIVRLRDGQGYYITDYEGTTQGFFTKGTNGRDGIVGTVQANDSGLEMNGAFVAIEYIE
jgi:hypothetical protein